MKNILKGFLMFAEKSRRSESIGGADSLTSNPPLIPCALARGAGLVLAVIILPVFIFLHAVPPIASSQFCYNFSSNLGIDSSKTQDITALQTALQKEGFNVSVNGTYDEKTASFVSAFQKKYRSDILTPSGFQYGTGYVGPATRAKLNSLYPCTTNDNSTSTLALKTTDTTDYILFYTTTNDTALDIATDKRAVVIYNHGGFASTNPACLDCKFLANQGFIVAAVKYANAISLQDDIQLVERVRKVFPASSPVFLMGVSRGGFLALQTFLKYNYQYKGAIIVAAPTSPGQWRTTLPLTPTQNAYFQSGWDAVANASMIQKPMLLVYGTQDDIVPASQGRLLYQQNTALFNYQTVNADHGLMAINNTLQIILQWLKDN